MAATRSAPGARHTASMRIKNVTKTAFRGGLVHEQPSALTPCPFDKSRVASRTGSIATMVDAAFASPGTLLPSIRPRSTTLLTSPRCQSLRATRFTAKPHASVSLDKEAAVKAAKRVYKAAKAEYKARKAEYKALKAELETQQKPILGDEHSPPTIANPDTATPAVNAMAVCDGKACCRMGADAVSMLLGKQAVRAPCMKMCGGVGPSVRIGTRVVKVDLKRAVADAVPADAKGKGPSKLQTNSVLNLVGEIY